MFALYFPLAKLTHSMLWKNIVIETCVLVFVWLLASYLTLNKSFNLSTVSPSVPEELGSMIAKVLSAQIL
jgi:hypothetical protein